MAQSEIAIVLPRRQMRVVTKQAMELTPRQARAVGKFVDSERRVEITLHRRDRCRQLLRAVQYGNAVGPRLFVDRRAGGVDLKFLRDADGEAGPVLLGDDVQEHVERRRRARAAVAVAVNHIEIVPQLYMREIGSEARGVLPIDPRGGGLRL